MSVTEKETKKQEGTCTTSSCSTDKEKSAQQTEAAKAVEVTATTEKTKKEHGSCCG
jgi:hypothetical protein